MKMPVTAGTAEGENRESLLATATRVGKNKLECHQCKQ